MHGSKWSSSLSTKQNWAELNGSKSALCSTTTPMIISGQFAIVKNHLNKYRIIQVMGYWWWPKPTKCWTHSRKSAFRHRTRSSSPISYGMKQLARYVNSFGLARKNRQPHGLWVKGRPREHTHRRRTHCAHPKKPVRHSMQSVSIIFLLSSSFSFILSNQLKSMGACAHSHFGGFIILQLRENNYYVSV